MARWSTGGDGGGGSTTDASLLTSGTLAIARIADGSITAAKVAADVATQAELDAASTADRARANHTGTQSSATISDLTEAVQDIVGAFLRAGTGTTVSYDDAANTFTINATASGGGTTDPEIVRDTIGSALVAGSGVQITVNDAGDTITIASAAVLPTRQVNSGTGLSGGGDLSADRTLTVAYGTTAGTAAQGNDTRFGVSGRRQSINAKTAAYTLAVSDEEKLITVDTAAGVAITLPTNASVALPVGGWVEILQLGAGQTTISAASGVTLHVPTGATAACRGQYARVVAQKIATDTWALAGDLA